MVGLIDNNNFILVIEDNDVDFSMIQDGCSELIDLNLLGETGHSFVSKVKDNNVIKNIINYWFCTALTLGGVK